MYLNITKEIKAGFVSRKLYQPQSFTDSFRRQKSSTAKSNIPPAAKIFQPQLCGCWSHKYCEQTNTFLFKFEISHTNHILIPHILNKNLVRPFLFSSEAALYATVFFRLSIVTASKFALWLVTHTHKDTQILFSHWLKF